LSDKSLSAKYFRVGNVITSEMRQKTSEKRSGVYTISELSKDFDVSTETIRYYEEVRLFLP